MELYQKLEYFLLTFQWFALLLAITTYPKFRKKKESIFLFLIIISVTIEMSTFLFRYFDITTSIQFNIFTLLSISIYHYWFYYILEKNKKLIVLGFVVFCIFYSYCISTESIINDLFLHPIFIGSLNVFVFSVLYFMQLLLQDVEVKIYSSQRFWIVTGLFIFNLGIAPVLYFQPSLDTFGIAYSAIITLLNIILYGSFIIGFLCLHKK